MHKFQIINSVHDSRVLQPLTQCNRKTKAKAYHFVRNQAGFKRHAFRGASVTLGAFRTGFGLAFLDQSVVLFGTGRARTRRLGVCNTTAFQWLSSKHQQAAVVQLHDSFVTSVSCTKRVTWVINVSGVSMF